MKASTEKLYKAHELLPFCGMLRSLALRTVIQIKYKIDNQINYEIQKLTTFLPTFL